MYLKVGKPRALMGSISKTLRFVPLIETFGALQHLIYNLADDLLCLLVGHAS